MNNKDATSVLRIMASGIELRGYTEQWKSGFKTAYEMAINALENERPKGYWIYRCGMPICSECQEVIDIISGQDNFCPNCGAKMREDSKDETN